MSLLWPMLIIFIAFAGFVLAVHIWEKKRRNTKLVCPLGADCDAVIHSKYGKFLGIPLEYAGGAYYAFIALGYATSIVLPQLVSPMFSFILVSTTIIGFIFSMYLTAIQAFVLKQWCTWCLMSAGFCTLILAIALSIMPFDLNAILNSQHQLLLVLHFVGLSLGLGGATISDLFFFKFLRDLRISEKEQEVLHTLSQIIWLALGLLVVSGLGLFLPNAATLIQSPTFVMKMIMVLVLILNGVALNLIVSPKLIHITFGQKHDHQSGELHKQRRRAFTFGAISISTWYCVFLLAILREHLTLGLTILLITYLAIEATAIIFSRLVEKSHLKKNTAPQK